MKIRKVLTVLIVNKIFCRILNVGFTVAVSGYNQGMLGIMFPEKFRGKSCELTKGTPKSGGQSGMTGSENYKIIFKE